MQFQRIMRSELGCVACVMSVVCVVCLCVCVCVSVCARACARVYLCDKQLPFVLPLALPPPLPLWMRNAINYPTQQLTTSDVTNLNVEMYVVRCIVLKSSTRFSAFLSISNSNNWWTNKTAGLYNLCHIDQPFLLVSLQQPLIIKMANFLARMT